MKKLYFPILMLSLLFFTVNLHAQPTGPQFLKNAHSLEDSSRRILLKPSILPSGGTLFVEQYRKQPFVLSFFNSGGARVGSYLIRDNSFYINTAGWGRGIYFYRAADAFNPFIDSGALLIL